MIGEIVEHTRDRLHRMRFARYAGAVAAVGASAALALWLEEVVDPTVVFLTGVSIVAWFSGLRPALLTALLATLVLDYFFIVPLYAFDFDVTHLPRVVAFTIIAFLFAGTTAGRRNVERSLHEAREELEIKVRERTTEIQEQAKGLEELAGRLIHAQEGERRRIGRELHDHISQMLGVLTIRLDQLRADEATPPPVVRALDELRQSATEITSDIHSLSHRLHSSALDYLGLVPGLQRLVNEFATHHGIAIEFTHAAVPAALPSDVALSLFRVTEESLTNIAKHSRSQSARVNLKGRSDGIVLTVEDDGTGFDPDRLEHRAGLGFVSMRERLRVIRGTVRVDSSPSRGTKITAWVPAGSLTPSAPDATAADEILERKGLPT
jgi:signal transduction histidine kinase